MEGAQRDLYECLKKLKPDKGCDGCDYWFQVNAKGSGICDRDQLIDDLKEANSGTTRLLSAREFDATDEGIGWAEVWLRGDCPENDEIILERVAWCGKHVAYAESGGGTKIMMLKEYNQPYGERMWIGTERPTDAEREAAAWER